MASKMDLLYKLILFGSMVFSNVLNNMQTSQVTLIPYTFSMDSDIHQLHTTWEVKGDMSISSICAYATVSMMEMSWTGDAQELSSGNSWAVNCQESETDYGKLQIDVDVTKFKVQSFKSYKVCISIDDYTMDYMDSTKPVCTHLFSFEKYVPYNPDDEVDYATKEDKSEEETDIVSEDDIEDVLGVKQSEVIESKQKDVENKVIETVLKHQLDNIEHYLRDDSKAKFLEIEEEFIEKFEEKILHSSDERIRPQMKLLICLIFARTIFSMTQHC